MTSFTRAIWVFVSCAGVACGGSSLPAPRSAPESAARAGERPAVFSVVDTQTEAEPVEGRVDSRIARVTVFSDRALVTREASSVALEKGTATYRFTELPGWVDEGSVRAAVTGGKIVDVRVEREFLARSSDAGLRRAERAHRKLQRDLAALDDEVAVLDAQQKHIGSIKVFSVEKLADDGVKRDISVENYGEVVAFISEQLRRTAEARRRIEARRVELTPEVEAGEKKLKELQRLTTLEQTMVSVTVEAPKATRGRLTLTYATPGATWEPVHELRAGQAHPDAVALTSFAVVTQTTGEDWRNAALIFSTQSSSSAQQIPELEMLALGEPTQTTRRATRKTSFTRAQEKYVEQNRYWNTLNQASDKVELERIEKAYATNLEYFERVQSRTVQIFQGLRRRGTTAQFKSLEPGTVRSDGQPVRLPIGGRTFSAREQIIAAPERSLNAVVTLALANRGAQPLLPGRVSRFFDGAFLGMTDVDFVAPGEPFKVFYRVADQVKLSRRLDKKRSSISRQTRNRMQLSFLTTAENLAPREVSLTVAERIPVSENSEIRVSRVDIQPTAAPDQRGIAQWRVTLKPGEKRTFRVSYQIDYPPSLVIDVKRKRKQPRPKGKASPLEPNAVAPDESDLEQRIIDFEDML
ncbi:MAG: mucoidy inhibitor MuiA family protein [Myxococcota bacterium]